MNAIHIFGIAMVVLGLFVSLFGGISTKLENDHCTASVVGTVVGEKYVTDENDKEVRKAEIAYTLPDGDWLVRYESDLAVGTEVTVWYNPDNPEEKYIEGFQESPFTYVFDGILGVLLGVAALGAAHLLQSSKKANDLLDIVDR